MPPRLFVDKRYIGPTLESLKCPATYATTTIPASAKGGRPLTVIKQHFAEEWLHSVTPDAYIHRDWPNRIYSPAAFDDIIAPFSGTDLTSRLMKKCGAIKSTILKYEPGKPSGLYGGDEQGSYVNTHCVSKIKPEPGDAGPWLEFMEHLIPNEKERIDTMRWSATLIAHPEVKMMYALLLISETQGVGKSTLGERILGPIIGDDNTSYPTEGEIVDSDYTYWLAHKRLAVVNEIYAGHSSKAYNKLKDIITGRKVSIKQKYMANYMLDNKIHILACSNNFNALKLTRDDRRWYIPKVTENKKPEAYWKQLNAWLNNEGGLQIIAHWAHEFLKTNAAVGPGEAAPWTEVKAAVAKEGYSQGMLLVVDVLQTLTERIDETKKYVVENQIKLSRYEDFDRWVMMDTDFIGLISDQVLRQLNSPYLEKPSAIRRLAKQLGWFVGSEVKFRDGTRGHLICSLASDAQRPPRDVFQEVIPTRIRELKDNKLMIEPDGTSGLYTRKTKLEDTETRTAITTGRLVLKPREDLGDLANQFGE
jgi:hypothetical protein